MTNNILGKRYGRLTILQDLGIMNKTRFVLCLCECGNIKQFRYGNLNSGVTKSCGCLQVESRKRSVKIMFSKNIKHGESKNNQLYNTWQRMKSRCYNKNSDKYKWYGGKGICVCNEWINNYNNFRDWSNSNGYRAGLTIDRINVKKGYSPDNCQWITMRENIEKEYTEDRVVRSHNNV